MEPGVELDVSCKFQIRLELDSMILNFRSALHSRDTDYQIPAQEDALVTDKFSTGRQPFSHKHIRKHHNVIYKGFINI